MLAGLIMAFLIGAPFLVAGAGHLARAAGLRALRTQATWSQVSATVPRAAPNHGEEIPGQLDTVFVQGRWTAPDGHPRSGLIAISQGVTVGNTTRIWVSRPGSPTGAPRERSELLGWTPIAEVGTALVLALIFFVAVRLQRAGCSSGAASLAGTGHGELKDRAGPGSASCRAPAHITPRG